MGHRSRHIALAPRREQRTRTRTGTPAAAARRYLGPRVYRAKLAPQRRAERAGSTRVRAVERAPHRQRASLCRAHASTPTPPALCAGAGALSSLRCARAALALRSRCATHTPASGAPEPWAIHDDDGGSPSSFLPSSGHCAVVTHVKLGSPPLPPIPPITAPPPPGPRTNLPHAACRRGRDGLGLWACRRPASCGCGGGCGGGGS